MSFSQTMRGRLVAAMLSQGLSVTGLSQKLGVHNTVIHRKLFPSATDHRPITFDDVDRILVALGEDQSVLSAPVLRSEARAMLEWIAAQPTPPTEAQCLRMTKMRKAVLRQLFVQELAAESNGVVVPTALGAHLIVPPASDLPPPDQTSTSH